jgi:hypothetical protein
MAKNTQMATAAVNAEANGLARALDNGYLQIYDGAQPADGDTAVTTQNLLVELRFAATSAPSASNGTLTFNAMTPGIAIRAGQASWYRALQSDHATPVMDGNVGPVGSSNNIELSTVQIQQGGQVGMSSFTHTVAKSATGL